MAPLTPRARLRLALSHSPNPGAPQTHRRRRWRRTWRSDVLYGVEVPLIDFVVQDLAQIIRDVEGGNGFEKGEGKGKEGDLGAGFWDGGGRDVSARRI